MFSQQKGVLKTLLRGTTIVVVALPAAGQKEKFASKNVIYTVHKICKPM